MTFVLSVTMGCGPTPLRIARQYLDECPAGTTSRITKTSTTYQIECFASSTTHDGNHSAGAVLQGPSLLVSRQELIASTITRIQLHNYHEGRLRGRMMEREVHESKYPEYNFERVAEWTVNEYGRKAGTEMHSSIVGGTRNVPQHIEWGADGRLLFMHSSWRTLDFPNGTGAFHLLLPDADANGAVDHVDGACFEGLRDGVWTATRHGQVLARHSWKRGVADGEFIMNNGNSRGMMRDGHRIGRWLEAHDSHNCILSTDPQRESCEVAEAPVRFVAVFDDSGTLVGNEDIVWETRDDDKKPKLIAGKQLPAPFFLTLGLNGVRCDELTSAASLVNLGMQ